MQGAYSLVVLWETLGSLGALELAYTEPQHAPPFLETPTETWQRPIHPYSRYDGLNYFRINELGAYLFGHSNRYTMPATSSRPFFRIDAKLHINPRKKALLPFQEQILPLLGTGNDKGKYELNKAEWLRAQQNEGTLKERSELLIARHDGPLKPSVEEWLEQCETDSTALRRGRTLITIQIRKPEVRDAILDDPELKRYCRLLDDNTLIIPSSREHAFMRKVLELGYGMVGGSTNNR